MIMRKWINRILCRIDGTTNIDKAKNNGLIVGENLFLGAGTFIDPSHCFLISIGNNVTLSSNVHILAHDASTKNKLGYTKIGKVKIGDNVFIGANSIVLPNVSVGDNSIIGAGSVVSKDIPPNEVWAGNPAKKIITTDMYYEKYVGCDKFDKNYKINNITDEKKKMLQNKCEEGIVLLE